VKFNLRKIKGMGRQAWVKEKRKAAVALKLLEKMGGKQMVRQAMKSDWYKHIDKALRGETRASDFKHWKKMRKKFKKNIVGEPNQETLTLLDWLKGFENRVKNNCINKEDKKWLRRFRSYMESCEKNAIDNYIIANKMVEA